MKAYCRFDKHSIMSWKKPELPYNTLPPLPPAINLDNPKILKTALKANRFLAELKGYSEKLPNPEMLLNTIILQESKDSSAIENIVTTQDELYQAIITPFDNLPANSKEVISYREAMYAGWDELKRTGRFTSKLAVKIMQSFKHTNASFRKLPGTKLKNPAADKIIYSPPDPQYIEPILSSWENYINTSVEQVDPLIVMALMHYQFEAIHPFTDGNGRTGRILNVLFLVHNNLLSLPVLYHSRYIIQHKSEYYRSLRQVTEDDAWEPWIIYMLQAVQETAQTTLSLIKNIITLKAEILQKIKGLTQKLPAYELNELIFSYPYIKIKVLEEQGIAQRQTASSYLQKLAKLGILHPFKVGTERYFVNHELMKILSNPI